MMKTIILCGGKGTRLQEETEFKPKALVQIGGYPILLHIMHIYSYYGYKDFVLALGYKGDMIKDYFLTLSRYEDDFEFDMKTGKVNRLGKKFKFDYKITFAETGLSSLTAKRVVESAKYIKDDKFMVTYGDGVSTVNINKLVDFHNQQEKENGVVATITVVHPTSKYGRITFNKGNLITSFEEKEPILDDYINGGFMVMNKGALDYMNGDEMLEDSLIKMVRDKKVAMYRHDGFWHCMDTMKDYTTLNALWGESRPWDVWTRGKEGVQHWAETSPFLITENEKLDE